MHLRLGTVAGLGAYLLSRIVQGAVPSRSQRSNRVSCMIVSGLGKRSWHRGSCGPLHHLRTHQEDRQEGADEAADQEGGHHRLPERVADALAA